MTFITIALINEVITGYEAAYFASEQDCYFGMTEDEFIGFISEEV